MSRIRIVKGKITEIVGGDLQYYSETDIVESAAETYSEKSAKTSLRNPADFPTFQQNFYNNNKTILTKNSIFECA